MANEIATYLKYANVQMAAEARLDLFGNQATASALIFGNDRSSKFTATQAAEFTKDWEVVEHKSNTATGFSGTLLRALHTDTARGITAGELVLSFRSTEFVDDNARDNKAANEMEIKAYGWAFGQIADMEKWYSELNADASKLQGKSFAVTGYSLGGHLATGGSNPVSSTCTFIASGVGRACVRPRHTSARGLKQPICYKNRSCLRNIYGLYSAKVDVNTAHKGSKHA